MAIGKVPAAAARLVTALAPTCVAIWSAAISSISSVAISSVAISSVAISSVAISSVGLLLTAPAHAHHSYSMYDGSIYRVFTGVMVRVVPNAAHFEMHFVPLNEERNALVRDEKGEPLVWVVQMESAAEAYRHGITRESFPQGTVISMGVHPRRDGRPAGDRGESGLFRCPEGNVPAPGMHCDSVEGSTAFGPGEIPAEGAAD